MACAPLLSSALSYSKKAGLSGEFRLRSSSEADVIASSRTGSGGTIVGSATGSGGAGGREALSAVVAAGAGGVGRATGGLFLWHAVTPSAAITTVAYNAARRFFRPSVIIS